MQVPPGPLGSPADAQCLLIEVPSKRSLPVLFLLAIWLPLWGFGMLAALAAGLVQREAGVLLCFPLMAVGFITAIHEALWQIAGRHHLELTGQDLLVGRTIGPLRMIQKFNRADVSGLRRSPAFGGGGLTFDCGAKIHSFGSGLDDAEANRILGVLQEAMSDAR